jgi:hypothetical protein
VLDEPVRVEQRGLAAGGRTAPHLARRHRARRDGDDSDAGAGAGPVTDANPGNIGDQDAAS